ncbi:hypothetical protein GCM10027422_34940 [Hymenobacter arcticus]
MSTDSTPTNSKPVKLGSPKRGRTRVKKAVALPDAPIILPKELAMVVDYHAYMSKHSGTQLTYEEVIQEAIINHVEALNKVGIQLPPMMAESVARFKATHPTFRTGSATASE